MDSTAQSSILVDIGNSTISWVEQTKGFDESNIHVIPTHQFDRFFESMQLFSNHRFIISSVVPDLNQHFDQFNSFFVDHRSIKGISLNLPYPEQVGADLLVSALAAYQLFNTTTLIVDSGTALTFSLIDSKGVYQGAQIFPGMGIASRALNDYTAKVPEILVKQVSFLIGNTTEQAVQSGLFHGYYHLIKGNIDSFKLKYPGLAIVGTGAGLSIYSNDILFDCFEPNLIFRGLSAMADVC